VRRWKTALSPIVPALCLAGLPVLAGAAGVPVAWASGAPLAASTPTLAGVGLPAPSSGWVLPAGLVQPGGPLQPGGLLRPGGLSQPLGRSLSLRGTRSTSTNWSGYVAAGGPFTSVTATWTQPRVRSSADFTDAAFWVGIDGYNAGSSDTQQTVEQIGTEGFTLQGVHYDAWYEMYPDYAHYITFGKGKAKRLMAIRPGDVITATVTWNGTSGFTLSIVNKTTGRSFSKVQQIAKGALQPERSSAEVVAEAPSLSDGSLLSVANFGLVRFRGCAFDDQPIGAFDWSRIDMVSQDTQATEVAASALSPDGTAFDGTTDFRRPVTKVVRPPAWISKPVTLRFAASDNPGGTGVAYTEYSTDGEATWSKGSSVRLPVPSDHSADGRVTVWYRSADEAGNLETAHRCVVHIDTREPTPVAPWPVVAARGGRATLRYYVDDPRPGSPTATVTIRIRDTRGALVKKLVLAGRPVDTRLACGFACPFARGAYRVVVSASDAAGNPSPAAATTTLTVR
jgi:Peptidase A4 family